MISVKIQIKIVNITYMAQPDQALFLPPSQYVLWAILTFFQVLKMLSVCTRTPLYLECSPSGS